VAPADQLGEFGQQPADLLHLPRLAANLDLIAPGDDLRAELALDRAQVLVAAA